MLQRIIGENIHSSMFIYGRWFYKIRQFFVDISDYTPAISGIYDPASDEVNNNAYTRFNSQRQDAWREAIQR